MRDLPGRHRRDRHARPLPHRRRGHHRITIDPAADHEAAIRCYQKAGFRRLGVMEAAWRDFAAGRWRDALLMELVVRPREERPGEVTPTTTGSEAREEQ